MTPTIEARAGWIGLQLSLVETLAAREGLDIVQGLTQFTSLRRRLGLAQDTTAWAELCRTVASQAPETARRTLGEMAARQFLMGPPDDAELFGCFHYNEPNDNGEVRIHFAVNAHGKEEVGSPLALEHLATRQRELAEMFRHIRNHHPRAGTLLGSSWLYNLESYRRLFPPAYGASARIRKPLPRMVGLSSWGQFFTHDGHLKPELVELYTARLDAIRLSDIWQLMPLPVMTATVPLQVMYRHYASA